MTRARDVHQTSAPLLKVEDLSVAYRDGDRLISAVQSVSFDIDVGRTVALVGQSGSGKSTIANALVRLLPPGQVRTSGRVTYQGRNLLNLENDQFRQLRGRDIGYVPQDPGAALNPVRKIGSQLVESLKVWGSKTPVSYREQAITLLARTHFSQPDRVLDQYPHQLSGGMLQRVLIAMAISARPKLLIADEPTSSLDVTVQRTILDLLSSLQREYDLGIILITHDLSIASDQASSIIVLSDGSVVESGPSIEIFTKPRSEFTRKLLADVPAVMPDKYAEHRARSALGDCNSRNAVEVKDLTKIFKNGDHVHTALDDVSLVIPGGTTHALVGESGSGKTTLARIVVKLEDQTSGSVFVNGEDITDRRGHQKCRGHQKLRRLRRNLQLVYQNPFAALDPRFTVLQSIEEPLRHYRVAGKSERRRLARELAARVGLSSKHLDVRPQSLSGGQRQRVAIARALAINPGIVVLDEPTSALDVTTQARILDLLVEFQDRLGLTYLFISHDLAVVRQFADHATVLRGGRVVESGSITRLFSNPQADYTRELLRSIPGCLDRPGSASGHR